MIENQGADEGNLEARFGGSPRDAGDQVANVITMETQEPIAADTPNISDIDSALGESVESSVASLSSSILQYQEENGRTYHGLSRGKYVLPNDEQENDRLDLQHELYLHTLAGALALCPKGEGARRVLDIGTGTGSWALDYADANPHAEVIGVDLSPIQPSFVPPNVSFEIDDLEKDWTWSRKFDFIFARMMLGCFEDFPRFVQVAFDNIEPGGYLELQDMALPALSDDDTLKPDSYLAQWCKYCLDAGQNLQRPIFPVTEYKNYLADAGFEDIVEVQRKWPINNWPRQRRYKDLGVLAYANIAGGLEGLSLAHFTRGLGWSAEETLFFCAQTRKDLKNSAIHAYWPIYFVYGRKPL